AGASVAEGDPGPGRRAVLVSGDAERASARLRDHVEGEILLEWTTLTESLDLGVDDARVDGLHDVVGQTNPLDGTGSEVFDHDVGVANHVLHQRQPRG